MLKPTPIVKDAYKMAAVVVLVPLEIVVNKLKIIVKRTKPVKSNGLNPILSNKRPPTIAVRASVTPLEA